MPDLGWVNLDAYIFRWHFRPPNGSGGTSWGWQNHVAVAEACYTITSVGFGDITPQNVVERAICAVAGHQPLCCWMGNSYQR